MIVEKLEIQDSISLRSLVKANWGKSSNFLTGINYTGNSGDLWTSLALKKEVTQRDFCLPRVKVRVNEDLFNLIPSWVKNLCLYEDITFEGAINEQPVKDLLDFIFIGDTITKQEFYFIFSNACLRNSSIFFYEKKHPLCHFSVKRFFLKSGELLVVPRKDFNLWLDKLHEA
ncbi:MAG: hypothetical protein H7281_05440 [Bacteriovorax sp.]|nr:hypothetical protein [Bacteriovorax sp.]